MTVLYRKYRPRRFGDVAGQKMIVRTLQNELSTGKTAHAYLFTGTRGTGKTSIARILAKALNCTNLQNAEPCLACDNCTAADAGRFLGLVEIDAASNTGVDNVRELIEQTQFLPAQGILKVFVIDEVHMLSKSAFNALLKTMEEPPEHVVFMLATTEVEKVPSTIVSRTQRFDFRPISLEDITDRLVFVCDQEKISIPKEVLDLIARKARGGLRDALSLLSKLAAFGEVDLNEARQLLGVTDTAMVQELIDSLFDSESLGTEFVALSSAGTNFEQLLEDVMEYVRLMLLASVGVNVSSEISETDKLDFDRHCKSFSRANLILFMRLLIRATKEMGVSGREELPLFLACLEISQKFVGSGSESVISQSKPIVAKQPVPVFSTGQTVGIVIPAGQNSVVKIGGTEEMLERAVSSVRSAKIAEDERDFEAENAEEVVELPRLNLALEEIRVQWALVVSKVLMLNVSLGNVLKNSNVVSVEPGMVGIGVKYFFHKEQIESLKNQSLLEKVLAEVFGQKGRVFGVIEKGDEEVGGGQVSDVLQVFGGTIIS